MAGFNNNNDLEKTITDDTDLLCHKAEIFRSKLIADFNLLDTISETGGHLEPPKFYTSDISDPKQVETIMKHDANGLVRFQIYSNKGEKQITDRRHNRIKTKWSYRPPFDLWAHWIVESTFFQNFILGLILMNSIILGVQGELAPDSTDPFVVKTKLVLEIFDYCAMIIYIIEILLKWLDTFWGFWKNRWNIFDFLITFLFLVPEIINLATGEWGKKNSRTELSVIVNNLRTFRILRSLKMVSRFQKVRLIVLAVTKAFQAMVFITVLLWIFGHIFAIFGVMFFKEGYLEAQRQNVTLHYVDSFSGIGNAYVTLFQLFTLDHWLEVYKDLTSVSSNSLFAAFYVILWIVIGSFIFRNIFVGIMVNNFQGIRNDLFQEVEEIQERERRDIQMQDFAEELDRQNNLRKASRESLADLDVAARRQSQMADGYRRSTLVSNAADLKGRFSTLSERSDECSDLGDDDDLRTSISKQVLQFEKDGTDWHHMVEKNFENIAKEEAYYCWPRDTMFRYLLIMEACQENIKERQEITDMIAESLMQIHDS